MQMHIININPGPTLSNSTPGILRVQEITLDNKSRSTGIFHIQCMQMSQWATKEKIKFQKAEGERPIQSHRL